MPNFKGSTIWHKSIASTVNCAIIFGISAPMYWWEPDYWKIATICTFFAYNWIFRTRCVGMMVAGTFMEPSANFLYTFLYTASFASLFYWIKFPLDIAIANAALIQLPCLLTTGNTLHGLVSKRCTMDKETYMLESVLNGKCPECRESHLKLDENIDGRIQCMFCHAQYDTGQFWVVPVGG